MTDRKSLPVRLISPLLRAVHAQFPGQYERLHQRYHDRLMEIKSRRRPRMAELTGNQSQCNFCGTVFNRSEQVHSEFLACPRCGKNARERTAIYRYARHRPTKKKPPVFFQEARILRRYHLLVFPMRDNNHFPPTCAPIRALTSISSPYRRYRLDLTDDNDIAHYNSKFDIILCSHVLEHIPSTAKPDGPETFDARRDSDLQVPLGSALLR